MDESSNISKTLTKDEIDHLQTQNKRLVNSFKANLLETNARKYWDLFYKRNETRFFKDRHWTTREFSELLHDNCNHDLELRIIFEVGCGVGNFLFPLLKEKLNFFIYACDFSPRAVEFVKSNALYNEEFVKAFVADITTDEIFDVIENNTVDIVTLVFVLSAIHPEKFLIALKNVRRILKQGGVVLFRDYGIYDMAQLRFKPGNKIAENFYMRQDGTRSYYFSIDFLKNLFINAEYEVIETTYVHRRTINKKENVDVPRIFVQGKFRKSDV